MQYRRAGGEQTVSPARRATGGSASFLRAGWLGIGGIGDGRRFRFSLEMMLQQTFLHHAEGRVDIVDKVEQVEILWGDCAVLYEGIEVDHFFPELRAVQH